MKKKFIFFFIIFILSLLLFFIFYLKFLNSKKLDVKVLNIGQGNSVLIKTENGKNILIDTGTGMEALRTIYHNLGFFNQKIDLLFLSHYDIDHAGNTLYFVKNIEVGKIFEPENSPYSALRSEILKYHKIEELRSGDKIDIGNIKIDILWPESLIGLNDNESSIVEKVYFRDKTFLIMGDLPAKFERYLVRKYKSRLKSDYLLLGHHGSKTSSSEIFLKTVNPDIAFISVGQNSFGLPNKEILDRLDKLNIKYLRTDQVGTIDILELD